MQRKLLQCPLRRLPPPACFADVASHVQYDVNISDLGKYTLVPPLLQALVGGFSGAIADGLIDRGYSIKRTRQILQVRERDCRAQCAALR